MTTVALGQGGLCPCYAGCASRQNPCRGAEASSYGPACFVTIKIPQLHVDIGVRRPGCEGIGGDSHAPTVALVEKLVACSSSSR